MAEDDRKPQTDPPEGSREVVDHELARKQGRDSVSPPKTDRKPTPDRR